MILTKIVAVLKKDSITALRYRNAFVFSAVAQGAQLATFYYLARAVGPQFRPDGMTYFLFLVVGTSFYTFLLAGIHGFLRTIQESQQTGTLEVLLTTSTSAPVLVALNALSSFAAGLVQFALFVAVGIFIAAPAIHPNILACLLVFLFSVSITFALGLFAAGVQISIHKGSAVLWLVGSGAWLLSGALFPTSALPHAVKLISQLVPFTHSLSGMRFALLAGNSVNLARELELLAFYSVLLVPASLAFFLWMVRQARQNGTLSFY
ncbi:MAG TPA: ABC transporter permease [Terriglobales bacterium]|nr:ABC transporter permease [Terriglobales bacterium]